MCQNGGLLVTFDYSKNKALAVRADCDSWSCPECKEKLRFMWVRRAQHGTKVLQEQGETLYFATITSHERNTTFDACAKVWPDAWKKLHKRINKLPGSHEYLLVPEKHKDGRMHVHAIWTFTCNTRWLKDTARECGLGYMALIGRRGHKDEAIESIAETGEYVSKYLGKDLGEKLPKHFRRVRTSQKWPELDQPKSELSGLEWEYVWNNRQLEVIYMRCWAEHLDLIDAKTGEMFDDIDLDQLKLTIV